MTKTDLVILITLALLLSVLPKGLAQTWQPLGAQTFGGTPNFVESVGFDSPFLLSATEGNLFLSRDNGQMWDRVLRIRGNEARINGFEISTHNPNEWFALTSDGLYHSRDQGNAWSRLFRGIGREHRNILAFTIHPTKPALFYLGTERGLFASHDSGKTWQALFFELSRKAIQDLTFDPINDELFIATSRVVYRFHEGLDQLKLIFQSSLSVAEEEPLEDESGNSQTIRKIILLNGPMKALALATAAGVFISSDEGESWERLPMEGIRVNNLVDLDYAAKQNLLFATTARGVFQYSSDDLRWFELYEGFASLNVIGLSVQTAKTDQLIAATQRGFFAYPLAVVQFKPEVPLTIDAIAINASFLQEPTIREVQRSAIRYANVSNGKIKRWHAASRMRAFLPDVSFKKGLDIGNNIQMDRGSTSKPDFFTQGPDDRDKSTDISLSWDLGDMLFSSSQTSIDSREKSMVGLRDEILSEVTRLYFERRRLRLELLANPPATPIEKMKAELRIAELTANLDGMTNGFFSKMIQKIKLR